MGVGLCLCVSVCVCVCLCALSMFVTPYLLTDHEHSHTFTRTPFHILLFHSLALQRFRNPKYMFDAVYKRSEDGKAFQKVLDYVHNHADQVCGDAMRGGVVSAFFFFFLGGGVHPACVRALLCLVSMPALCT